MTYSQDQPFAIQIEPAEGCSLACEFCALQSIRNNGADWKTKTHGKNSTPYKFMKPETAERLAFEIKRLGWNPRIEAAMHGEPSANKDLEVMITLIRSYLPKVNIMITSNGSGFIKAQRVVDSIKAGLNTLALDDYLHANFVDRVIDNLVPFADELAEMGVDFYRYPRDPEGNPHQRLAPGKKMISVINDLTENQKGTHSNITNQGGGAGKLDFSMKDKRCAKPFRELSVRWDGNVAICCDDWAGDYKIGNINEMPLDKIWNHPRFEAARKKLYHKERDFGPCLGCNVATYRTGLLPDKKGKVVLPRPEPRDYRAINGALAGGPFTPRVRDVST